MYILLFFNTTLGCETHMGCKKKTLGMFRGLLIYLNDKKLSLLEVVPRRIAR